MIARLDIFRDIFGAQFFFIIGARQEKKLQITAPKMFCRKIKRGNLSYGTKHIGLISNQCDNICSPIDRRF